MAASYVMDGIRNSHRVSSLSKIDTFRFSAEIDGRDYTVYTPSNDDYEVTVDVVDRAIELGANIIVCDKWIKITSAGFEYAKRKRIKVYGVGAFIGKINNGESI